MRERGLQLEIIDQPSFLHQIPEFLAFRHSVFLSFRGPNFPSASEHVNNGYYMRTAIFMSNRNRDRPALSICGHNAEGGMKFRSRRAVILSCLQAPCRPVPAP